MTVPVLTFFNIKGGLGKTSLVYHLACMYSELGYSVLAADLDPQCNLTSMFLEEGQLETLWGGMNSNLTVYGAIQPLLEDTGDIRSTHLEQPLERLSLIVGDLSLSLAEDELSCQWPACLDGTPRAFLVTSALWRIMQRAAKSTGADIILVDVGSGLGALCRAVLVATDYVTVPMAADPLSLQGLRYLGGTLKKWRTEWEERRLLNPLPNVSMPQGRIKAIGYVVQQPNTLLGRPGGPHVSWAHRIPGGFAESLLEAPERLNPQSVATDPHYLSMIKHYRSLLPLSQEARKPIFKLTTADGAVGSHAIAVRNAYNDFQALARAIAVNIPELNRLPSPTP